MERQAGEQPRMGHPAPSVPGAAQPAPGHAAVGPSREIPPFFGSWFSPIHFTQPRGSGASHIDRKNMKWVTLPVPLPVQSSPQAQTNRERVAQGDVQGTVSVLVQELHTCWLCSNEPKASKKCSSSPGRAPRLPSAKGWASGALNGGRRGDPCSF